MVENHCNSSLQKGWEDELRKLPVILTSIPQKVMEQFILDVISKQIEEGY